MHLFKDGESTDSARFALYGVAHCCCMATRSPLTLPLAKASLAGFAKCDPPSSRDPAPWEAVLLLAEDLARYQGLPRRGAYLLICFDLYTRPSEALSLQKSHIHRPIRRPGRDIPFWTVTVFPSSQPRTSKVGTQDDTVLLGAVGSERRWLSGIMGALYARARLPTDRMFPFELADVERDFKAGSKKLHLESLRLLPHMLRHGGPSHDILQGVTTKLEVQSRGHWACIQSVNRYEKRGRLVRQLGKLTAAQVSDSQRALKWLKQHLAQRIKDC